MGRAKCDSMSESKASRTLLKSPPELWSEVSSASSLQRHMDEFGGIRITKLEPETAVAWEGEHARGTITLEPSGWGTRVSLTAEPLPPDGGEADPRGGADPETAPAPQSGAVTPSEPGPRAQPAAPSEPGHPAPPTDPAEHAPPTSLAQPYEAVDAEIRELTAFLERSRCEAQVRKRRWPRRVAEAVRRWLHPEAELHAVPAASEPHAPGAAPDLHAAPATPKEQPAPPEPTPDQSAPEVVPGPDIEGDPEPVKPAALTAALDSLGQAHHRPFSRA